MSVGELAKKMHTTVRTLQYYDKEKVLCPSTKVKAEDDYIHIKI